MPTVKHAFERHKILDRCFRDRRRKYYIGDLMEIVNKDMLYYHGTEISERTLRSDIQYMMDSNGYSAPIIKGMDGHRAYYYYSEADFSILNLPMSQKEMEQLSDTIQMLSRFKGLPDCAWIEETLMRFENTFHLNNLPNGIVYFSQNPALKGMKWFTPLYNAIVNKTVVNVSYAKFRQKPYSREIHPYQLRQYNNRWFLVGFESNMKDKLPFVVIPIDRILGIKLANDIIFQQYLGADLDDYFEPVVGVSVNIEAVKEMVVIKAFYPAAGYIETKPFHNSQKIIEKTDEYTVFELNLIPNYEFESQLLCYLDECVVVKPERLRRKLIGRIEKMMANNK